MTSITFCIFPFISMVTRNSGELGICCRSTAVGHITQNTLTETWNNDTMKRVRLELLDGKKPIECAGCWRHEDIGIESKRTRNLDLSKPESMYSKFNGVEKSMLSDGTMPTYPQILEIRVNNLCNLKCRMCSPLDSSSWNDWHIVKDIVNKTTPKTVQLIDKLKLEERPLLDRYGESFYIDLLKIIPNLKQVDFSGGEPLTNPAHYRIVDMLMPYAKNIILKYDTNLLNLTFKKVDLFKVWDNFKGINLNVSVDGIDKIYDHIRTNGNFCDIKSNLDKVSSYHKLNRLVIASAISIYNIHDITNITRLAASYNAIHHMCKVSFPEFLSCQILPADEKKKIISTLTAFLHEIPNLYCNEVAKNYITTQYKDLMVFLQIEKNESLMDNFVNYETKLNTSRNTLSLNHIPGVKNV